MQNNSPTLRVLVVEDEPLIRWSLTETLEGAGHTVQEAGDAATALSALKETPKTVDVVLLDFRLPDSNDLALLTRIRRLTPDSVVVMMTAYGTAEMTETARALGVYRVLNKPIDMHELPLLVLEAYNYGLHGRAARLLIS